MNSAIDATPTSTAPSTRQPLLIDRRSVVGLLAVILGVAAGLRFYGLAGKSLWIDEILSAPVLKLDSFGSVINWLETSTNQMPAFPLTAWLIRGLGDNEITLRLPAAAAGTLAVLAVFFVGRELFGNLVGLVSAALMALLPFGVVYSQEARAYSLLMLASALQILFLYRARKRGRWLDWAAFTAASVLNVYTHYVGLAATFAAFSYLGLSMAIDLVRRDFALRQAARAVASGALILLAYVPWLPTFRQFLRAPNTALSAYGAGTDQLSLGQGQSLLQTVGFSSLIVGAIVIGLFVLGYRMGRDRDRSLLLLLWLAVPLAGFAVVLNNEFLTVQPRYIGFLYPAVMVIGAVGVESAAGVITRILRRGGRAGDRAGLSALAAGGVTLALIAQTIPVLAGAMLDPKEDYRGLVAHVVADSSPESLVVGLGANSYGVTVGVDYYINRQDSPIEVVDGARIDNRVVNRASSSGGSIWGAIRFPSEAEVQTLSQAGLTAMTFTDLILVRAAPDLPPLRQLTALLSWDAPANPAFSSAVDVIDAVNGSASLGPSILDQSSLWHLDPNTTRRGTAIALNPVHTTLNAWAQVAIIPGSRYLFDFQYRNPTFVGRQDAFVFGTNASGHRVYMYPDSPIFECERVNDWTSGMVGFTVPTAVQSVTVQLRASGSGEADFDSVRLRRVL
jgi:4-amino-4-deoxy-L-arabinose transferase-like glycosyltransferase